MPSRRDCPALRKKRRPGWSSRSNGNSSSSTSIRNTASCQSAPSQRADSPSSAPSERADDSAGLKPPPSGFASSVVVGDS